MFMIFRIPKGRAGWTSEAQREKIGINEKNERLTVSRYPFECAGFNTQYGSVGDVSSHDISKK